MKLTKDHREHVHKPVTFFVTNYKKGIIKKKVTANLLKERKNDYLTEGLTLIHIFDSLPFMRNIPANKEWFERNLYSFN